MTKPTRTKEATRTSHHLSDADRSYLAELVASSSLAQAARELELPRQTVVALLTPASGTRAGTVALARERIDARRRLSTSTPPSGQ